MIFRSNINDVQLIVGMEMEEDIKREAFVSTNDSPASNEDDINSWIFNINKDDIWPYI